MIKSRVELWMHCPSGEVVAVRLANRSDRILAAAGAISYQERDQAAIGDFDDNPDLREAVEADRDSYLWME